MKKIVVILISVAFLLVPFSASGSSPARLVTTQIEFYDGFGREFESGQLSWESVDGLSRSSTQITAKKEFGTLVANLTLPEKEIYIRLSNFMTADGLCIQGQKTFFPSQGERDLVLPAYEEPVEQKVKVKLPGGYPVPNAIVAARLLVPFLEFQGEDFSGIVSGTLAPQSYRSSMTCPDFNKNMEYGSYNQTFPSSWKAFDGKREDGIKARDVTNRDGIAILKGWDWSWDLNTFPAGQPGWEADVEATFDDGIIYQRTGFKKFDADRSTVLTLDYLPVVVYSSGDINAFLNDVVELPISVIDPPQIEPAFANNFPITPKRAQLQGISKATSVFSGVQVEVVSPSVGSSKVCPKKQLLKAKTNSRGQATLKVCASVSGTYTIKGKGAVGVSSFLLRVKGAPPMAPTALNAEAGIKKSTVAWGLPTYAGGAPILKYVITATASGQKTRKIEVKANTNAFKARSLDLTGLAAPKNWQVSVVAVTKHGESEKASVFVNVANK